MPAAQASFIPELEEALRHVSVDEAAGSVRRITDLFLAGAARFNEQHVHLFDRILGRLIVAIDTGTLAQLARRLAPVRNAPPDIIRRLAGNDAIAVAAPVLTRSPRLEDADLVAIATTKSQAHLLAISGRSSLGDAIADALVDCGDRDVARNVAMNPGARFSAAGFMALAKRAANDGILAEKLARRQDVPPQAFRSFLAQAAREVRQRLLAAARPETRADIERLVAETADDAAGAAEDLDAWQSARALQRAGPIDEARLLELARSGRVKETIAALALICDMSISVVRRLVSGDQPDAALILCQAAGFSWPTACAIVQAGNGMASPAGIDKALAELDRLSPTTAERIVGFWRACHGELRAAS